MEEKISALKAGALFGSLAEEDLERIADVSITKRPGKGEIIFREGDESDGFYVVVKGKVSVAKFSVEGKRHILHIFGRGEPFGEAAAFSGGRFPATAEAAQDAVCLYIRKGDFTGLIKKYPGLALNMLETLSQRLRKFAAMIEDLSLKEVSARLARYLLDLSARQNNSSLVELDVTKTQLAGRLGTISETVSRTFRRMKSEKLISGTKNEVRLLDMERLKKLAAGYRL